MEPDKEFRKTYSLHESSLNAYDSPQLIQVNQYYPSTYYQKASVYNIDDRCDNSRSKLLIYNTQSEIKKEVILKTKMLDRLTCIIQLPNGKLFCFGKSSPVSGVTMLIDDNGRVERLPSGIPCGSSSAIYFDNNVYCFGGLDNGNPLFLSSRFDLKENRWIKLTPLPKSEWWCNSVTFNRNILISGRKNKNLWLYSIDLGSFSTIPHEFEEWIGKILINAEEKLFLIMLDRGGSIYESNTKNFTTWREIGNSILTNIILQVYCSYNKEAIYIGCMIYRDTAKYFKFNLNEKSLTEV